MLVSDIYLDAQSVLGRCDQALVFKRLTEAVRLLSRKARWDSTLGNIDICVCASMVTLPAECKTVLGVLTNGSPSHVTDSWFQFHMNGPGAQDCMPIPYTRVTGTFPVFRDPSAPCVIVAKLDSAADNNKTVRVFGFDRQGNEIYTPNVTTGVMEPGALVPTIFGYPVPETGAPHFARITRVQKDVTAGFVHLYALNPSDLSAQTLLGRYLPEETNPQYQRLAVGPHTWVRVRYQKKDEVIRSMNDWININDPHALLMALKAIRFRYEDKFADAEAAEATASRLMSEEQKSLQPNGIINPQIINGDTWNFGQQESVMFYGDNGYWGASGIHK